MLNSKIYQLKQSEFEVKTKHKNNILYLKCIATKIMAKSKISKHKTYTPTNIQQTIRYVAIHMRYF